MMNHKLDQQLKFKRRRDLYWGGWGMKERMYVITETCLEHARHSIMMEGHYWTNGQLVSVLEPRKKGVDDEGRESDIYS